MRTCAGWRVGKDAGYPGGPGLVKPAAPGTEDEEKGGEGSGDGGGSEKDGGNLSSVIYPHNDISILGSHHGN